MAKQRRQCPALLPLSILALYGAVSLASDPFAYFDWTVSYLPASPLGIRQQVIAINGLFPGPILNVTTNWNLVINVKNTLDEPVLIAWNGIQNRKNAWQDGVLGTNCPIPPGWNWTYQFQVKDQIGSFFYFPSLNFQRAAGGYGGIVINNRDVIPVPFPSPDGDVTVFISDWYAKSHKDLGRDVLDGKNLGTPDGVLINGYGPYQGKNGGVYQIFNVESGKTYRFRVHNVGVSTSLNFRIQNHTLVLVETEGSYTAEQRFSDVDIHVGQSYSFLVKMDQDPTRGYYVVASPRFIQWKSGKMPGVAVLSYASAQAPAGGPLPDAPSESDAYCSMTQARSIRWNLTVGAARPNAQGSFHYGDIKVNDVFVIGNRPSEMIGGRWRRTLNGISYWNPDFPLTLARSYNISGVFKLDFPNRSMNRAARVDTSLIDGEFKSFVEIIFENKDTAVQAYHMDGYAFFVVGMEYGEWTEGSRGAYNKWDGVARSTVQVFPGAWTAVLVYLDNAGIWNLRAENLDSWYLGQELYISVVNGEKDGDEAGMPANVMYCGLLSYLQKDQETRFEFFGGVTRGGFSLGVGLGCLMILLWF